MIFAENGINWIWFYDTNNMSCWREHKNNIITKADKNIAFWSNNNGASGININHYRKTGKKISYVKDTINTDDKETFQFNYDAFSQK